jgi:hypothetical protein
MDPHVRASLSESQRQELVKALVVSKRAHTLDVRGVLPLYFARFYLVFQFGRDRRLERRRIEDERRLRAILAGNVVFFVVAISPLVVLALIGLYLLKAALGIDLIPDFHLPNLLPTGRN